MANIKRMTGDFIFSLCRLISSSGASTEKSITFPDRSGDVLVGTLAGLTAGDYVTWNGTTFVNTAGISLSQTLQNVVHVAKNGTDTRSGVNKYSLFTPFLTIQAAINAAASGDTVVVHPGTYSEQLTLKTGVNMHYDNGAISMWTPTGHNQGLITDGGSGCTCVISGDGKFELTTAAYNNQFLLKTTAASNLIVEGISFSASGTLGTELGLYDSGGSTWVIRANVSGMAVYPGHANSDITVYGNLTSARSYAIYQDAGLLKVYGNVTTTYASTPTPAIYNTAGRTQVFDGTITGTGSAIECVGTSNVERLRLVNCELVAANNLYAIDYSTGTDSVSLIKDCILRPNGSAPYCLRSDTAGTAYITVLNSFGTAAPTGGAGSFTVTVMDYIEEANL